MSTLVESLKRLYQRNDVTIEQLQERLTNGTINQGEYDYIIK